MDTQTRITILKKIVLAVALLVILAVVAVPAYFYGAYPKLRPAPAMTAPTTPDAIERGRSWRRTLHPIPRPDQLRVGAALR